MRESSVTTAGRSASQRIRLKKRSAFSRPSAEMSPAMHVSTEPLHVPSARFAVSAFQRAQVASGLRSPAAAPPVLAAPALAPPALAPPTLAPPLPAPLLLTPPLAVPAELLAVPPEPPPPLVVPGDPDVAPALAELAPALELIVPPVELPALALFESEFSVLEQPARPGPTATQLKETKEISKLRRNL